MNNKTRKTLKPFEIFELSKDEFTGLFQVSKGNYTDTLNNKKVEFGVYKTLIPFVIQNEIKEKYPNVYTKVYPLTNEIHIRVR